MKLGLRALRKRLRQRSRTEGVDSFRALFDKFREILRLNTRVLELISDMGDKLSGDYVFDTHYLETTVTELDDLVHRIIYTLNAITGNRYLKLYQIYERIREEIHAELVPDALPRRKEWVLPLEEANLDLINLVGAKMGTLGEIGGRLGRRVPPGFVITTNAYRRLVGRREMEEVLAEADRELEEGGDPTEISRRLQAALRECRIPESLERAVRQAVRRLETEGHRFFSVRSSALGEDGELSFAGQYRSFLQVPPEAILDRYREVVASLFSPEAIVYRREHGIDHQTAAMAVGVQAMANPKVSGVMYTRDPEAPDPDAILISAAWGLGRTVVEGITGTDFYRLDRYAPDFKVLERRIGEKRTMLVPDASSGEREEEVPAELREKPCLTDVDLRALARLADRLETYFRKPQDVEWCLDGTGEPILLQSRPLRVRSTAWNDPEKIANATRSRPRLLEGAGMVACRGIGAGRVIQVLNETDFDRFERGSVLVARSTSPKLSRLIPLAAAVVTDIGTPTGHMATVAREYRVPTLVDTGRATECLKDGMEVTVDAEEGVVYEGIIKELLQFQTLMEEPFTEAAEFRILRRLLKKISPLSLTDPQSSEFAAENCRSYHDITRFCHEMVVKEFIGFHLRDRRWKHIPTYGLSIPVPLGLILIDMGGGIVPEPEKRVLKPEEVISAPLRALLKGLCMDGVWRTDPVSLDFRSFMTSFTATTNTAVMSSREAQNLAVITRDYLNLNLRLGYHFNMIDTLMTDNRNDNYIYFRFLGGVTDLARRSRRAKFLAEVLAHYDFVVEVKGDLVIARIAKVGKESMEGILAMLGRLIGYARQLDVLMRSDENVEGSVREFLAPDSTAESLS